MENDPDQIARIEAYLGENLSPARFRHVMGVREVALTPPKPSWSPCSMTV